MDITNLTPKPMRKGKNGKRGTRYYDAQDNLVAKTCTRCEEIKPTSDFAPAKAQKDGLFSSCRDCASAYQKDYHTSGPLNPQLGKKVKYTDRTDQQIQEILSSRYPDGLKKCSTCGTEKTLDEFYQNKSNASVVASMCIECTKGYATSRTQKLVEEDPDYYKKTYQKYKDIWKDRTREELMEARSQSFPEGTKECRRCKKLKSIERFSVVPSVSNATASTCKDCINRYRRDNEDPDKRRQYERKTKSKRKARTTRQLKEIQERLYPEGTKECKKCRETLPLRKFIRDAYTTDGLRRNCNRCRSRKHKDRCESHWRSHNIPFECYICQGPYEHSDHVIPTTLGGSDEPTNRLPICAYHNGSKNGNLLEDWLASKHHDIMAEVLDKVMNVYNVEIIPYRK